MAVIGSTYLTIADKLKRQTPDGERIATVIELLSETNDFMQDMITLEGNTQTGHRTTMRSGLPTVTFRKIYGFTQPSKSTTIQVDETCGTMEGFSIVDKKFADMNGDVGALRLSEDQGFFQALNQEFAETMFYGNTDTAPEEFLGLAPRLGSLSASTGSQIVDAGGTGSNNTSMWLLKWGEQHLHGIYPKGSMGGLQHTNMGVQTETNSSGGKRVVYQTHYTWDVGLALRDFRHIARIANIDVPALASIGTGSDTSADLINNMIDAIYKLENLKGGKVVFYCGRTVHAALTKKAVAKENVNLSFTDFGGEGKIMTFQGIPIKMVDALLSTEARVV